MKVKSGWLIVLTAILFLCLRAQSEVLPGSYYWGDADGNGWIELPDIGILEQAIFSPSAEPWELGYGQIPPDPPGRWLSAQWQDLDGNSWIDGNDIKILESWKFGNFSDASGNPVEIIIEDLNPSVSAGSSIELRASAKSSGGAFRTGWGIIFEIVSGSCAGALIYGRYVNNGEIYDYFSDRAYEYTKGSEEDGWASVKLKVPESCASGEQIMIRVYIPADQEYGKATGNFSKRLYARNYKEGAGGDYQEIVVTIEKCEDNDGDGWFFGCASYEGIDGPDCNDNDPTIYPAAPEIYGDGIDQDCDGREPDKFLIDPHLQLGNQESEGTLLDRITVCWENSQATTGTVLYGTTFPPDTPVNDLITSSRHEVMLTGLNPATRYFYQVLAGTSVGPIASFRTAPLDPHQPFRFAYIADTRDQHTIHQALIYLSRSWNPLFIIHGGDMVRNGTDKAQWLTYFDIERPLLQFAPIAPVIGNHDIGLYADHFSVPLNLHPSEFIFSWNYGNIHFLHTTTEHPSGEQDTLISLDLAQASASYPNPRFIVVVMHRNVYSNWAGYDGGHWGDENYPYSTIWGPMFEQAKVAVVLQAHAHLYERFEPIDNRTPLGDPPGSPDVIRQGVTYVTGGGGGAPLHPAAVPPGFGGRGTPPLNSLVAESTYESMLIEVSGGEMHILVFRLDNSLLDEFYIIRNLAPVADAGADFFAPINTRIFLDGSASTDSENDPLNYQWTQLSGPRVSLNNANTPYPDFLPSLTGEYIFELMVDDGIDSATDQITVTITE